jgi:hypothetical protein
MPQTSPDRLPSAGGPPPFLARALPVVIAHEGLDRELERRIGTEVPVNHPRFLGSGDRCERPAGAFAYRADTACGNVT